MTSQPAEKRVKKQPVSERLKALVMGHDKLFGVLTAVLVAGCLGLLFWFTVYSGLSGSADFIYAQF